MKLLAACVVVLHLAVGCAQSTKHLPAVRGFSMERYAGKWYEIARFPHRFERGLAAVTAEYTPQDDGRIMVVNVGFDPAAGKWKSVTGHARPVGNPNVGELKVTFLWPFSGTYKILALDRRDYSFALVTGDTYDYLWILGRTPVLPPATIAALTRWAKTLGFDVNRLQFVQHEPYH